MLCQGKKSKGMVNRASGWSPPFLWTPRTHCKVCWQQKSSFLSAQPASLLSSPFCSVACLWLPESLWSCPHTYWRGFWGIHQCAAFSSGLPFSPYLHLSVNLSLFLLSPSVCISLLKKKEALLHSTILLLLLSLSSTCPLGCPPPLLLSFSHHLAPIFFSSYIFFFLLSVGFCFVD